MENSRYKCGKSITSLQRTSDGGKYTFLQKQEVPSTYIVLRLAHTKQTQGGFAASLHTNRK